MTVLFLTQLSDKTIVVIFHYCGEKYFETLVRKRRDRGCFFVCGSEKITQTDFSIEVKFDKFMGVGSEEL
jgi:hypothetical protein